MKRCPWPNDVLLMVVALVAQLGLSAAATAGTFTLLGYANVGDEYSSAAALSADGSVVVGTSEDYDSFETEAFRWESGVMTGLGVIPGDDSSGATSVSADGSVVVGISLGDVIEAYRWQDTPSCDPGGVGNPCMVGLGFLDGFTDSDGTGVSGDGKVVVGQSSTIGDLVGFRWEDTPSCMPGAVGNPCMVGLEGLPATSDTSNGLAISSDGSVIVGEGAAASFPDTLAVQWNSSLTISSLGVHPLVGSRSAIASSSDGLVIVGKMTTEDINGGTEAFRWKVLAGCDPDGVANDCMVGLGDLDAGELESAAHAVSGSGLLVVGRAHFNDDLTGDVDGDGFGDGRAFIWDPLNGMRDLNTVVTGEGTSLSGWTLISANAVSSDGTTIAGDALNASGDEQAFAVTIAVPEPGLLPMWIAGISGLVASAHRRDS